MRHENTDNYFQGYEINNHHSGYYPIMMARILKCHRYATTTRGRNLFLMLTLTVPQTQLYLENTFSSFLEVFIRQANRDGLAPVYFWVREQFQSSNPHFHLCLWISGYWRRNPFGVISDIQQRWNRCFGLPAEYKGLVGHSISQPAIFLDRNDINYEVNYRNAIFWASYAAKVNKKSTVPPHCRVFGSSQIPDVNLF